VKAISEQGPASRLESFWFLRKNWVNRMLIKAKRVRERIKNGWPLKK
jgi:hypothetical protein